MRMKHCFTTDLDIICFWYVCICRITIFMRVECTYEITSSTIHWPCRFEICLSMTNYTVPLWNISNQYQQCRSIITYMYSVPITTTLPCHFKQFLNNYNDACTLPPLALYPPPPLSLSLSLSLAPSFPHILNFEPISTMPFHYHIHV